MNHKARIGIIIAFVTALLVGIGLVYLLGPGDSAEDQVAEEKPTATTPFPAEPSSTTEAVSTPPAAEPSPTPEREPTTAAVITVHPLATQAAMDVLADGGTAADAAFAVAAVLSVVEPNYSSVIAGETSALYHDGETGEIRSMEAVGTVGSDFDLDSYRSRGATGFGLYQALVPGAWSGWILLLEEEGELGLDRLLEPAITLARDGHEASAALASQARSYLDAGGMNAPSREIYAPLSRYICPDSALSRTGQGSCSGDLA